MKIAITGGAGFLGSHLTTAYLDAGHNVIVIDNLNNGSVNAVDPRARFYQIDIRDEKLRAILANERPDVVSHHVNQHLYEVPLAQSLLDADTHIRGLLHVLDSCVNASVRKFIFASGGNTLYGPVGEEYLPLSEETPLQPRQPADISRAAGEWYVRYYSQQHGLTHAILRYADVYGGNGKINNPHPLNYFLHMLSEGRRPIIRGTGESMHDHIAIDDVMQANLQVLTRGNNQTLHISRGEGYTLKQLYLLAAQALGSDIEPVYISGALAEDSAIILDNTRARQVLDWQPRVSLQEGITHLLRVQQQAQDSLNQQPQFAQVSRRSSLAHV
ncbi:UDP-glucose 4-epimerase [Ktedonobacter sp. SOSP1-52]|uniref:NAD-dependent epimerase/dehydratase family protein n=1 Tax=Ktedonobacter sp. SOSP1-52 TaxID=2778366 RepID=UPI0019162D88|nr:NAD-dependent epimerase/dehydratase family protein [Ktedonobacter sp. SOSP1-52]GHO67209.1 UDP-glucose 4-epimerase [Ktedonobacter sp. SOSP1-52]